MWGGTRTLGWAGRLAKIFTQDPPLEDRYIVVGFFDNQLLHFDRIVKQCNMNCIENIRNGPSTHCPKLFQQNFSAKLLDKSLDCFRQLYFSGEQRLLIIFISFSSICCTIDTKLLATNKTIKLKCSKCSKTKSITYCGRMPVRSATINTILFSPVLY